MRELALPRSAEAPRLARRAIERWFAEPLAAEERETATLLVSELVSNAVRHGRGGITLRADLDDNRLLVEVIDQGRGLERAIREHEFAEVGGWGLRLVEDASSRWGAYEDTTHVWFELERFGPRLGADEHPARPRRPPT